MAGVISVIGPEKRIELNPYDVDAWNLLLRENTKKTADAARPFYENLVEQFPNAGRYWKAYIEHELRGKNFEGAEALFGRCLLKVLNIDLWKCYVHYVRETKGHLASFRESMAKAYDFALEKVGLDFLAYPLYMDYISFLKAVPAVGQYAENQKITAVRKVYQRGVLTPLLNIEQLWAEYCSFEKSVNSALAEKLIAERNRDYQQARKISRQLELQVRGINRMLVSVPPCGTPAELKQLHLWKDLIRWEKGNPLATEDYGLYAKRVVYTFEQALLCLGYHPDIWYDCAIFMQEAAKSLGEKGDSAQAKVFEGEVSALYDRATTTLLKDVALIYFAYADYEEEKMRYAKVAEIYERLIALPSIDPTLAYIQYMKFARRTEGIKAARAVFKKAREEGRCRFHVYVAAAHMEYYCSKDAAVGMRIFELGLKKFADEPEFALAFTDFLAHLNEDNNTRVLFERILTSGSLPPESSLEVWDRYLEFETQVGDLASINKVDRRRSAALAKEFKELQTLLLIDRYKFLDLLPCSSEQLRILGFTTTHKGRQQGSFLGGWMEGGRRDGKDHRNGGARGKGGGAKGGGGGGGGVSLAGYPVPDLSQMIPFKPKIITTSSYHPVSGGVFPPPPAVAHLLSLIPPPWCFNGPFVGVDGLVDSFRSFQLPDAAPQPQPMSSQSGPEANGKMDEIKKEFYQLLATTPDPIQVLSREQLLGIASNRKRPRGDSEDEPANQAPVFDIYRQRQAFRKT